MAAQVYWQRKTLAEMSRREWEMLCDGCGKCCLHKLEDEDTGQVYYTDVACKLLGTDNCQCSDYANRQQRVPECLVLTPQTLGKVDWLPATCAYRRLASGQSLPDWHPLVTGDRQSTLNAGWSVAGRVRSECEVDEADLEEHIIHWVT